MATTTKITHFTAHDKPGEPLPKKRPPTNFLSLWVSMDILNQLPSSTASPHWAVKCDSFPHSLAAGLLGPVAGTTSCTLYHSYKTPTHPKHCQCTSHKTVLNWMWNLLLLHSYQKF